MMIFNLLTEAKVPKKIPKELEKKIKEFVKSRSREKFLTKSFIYVTKKYGGARYNLVLKFFRLFDRNIFTIFNTKGYLHCTQITFLLRVMMIKSGLFKAKDVKQKLTSSWCLCPHQYLKVRVSKNKVINVDGWAYQFGIEFGNYARGFNCTRVMPIR